MRLIEKDRLQALCRWEIALEKKGYRNIAGVDEAGRGPLAGPVVACCCLYHQGLCLPGINDSKKLSSSLRKDLYTQIIQHKKTRYALGIIDAHTIDQVNILQATLQAMKIAIEKVAIETIDYLLIDGNQLPDIPIEKSGIIKGDQKSISIAAASIIAKEARDAIMKEYHQLYPEYLFSKHKGYPTKQHKQAIIQYGPCPIHRKTFANRKKKYF